MATRATQLTKAISGTSPGRWVATVGLVSVGLLLAACGSTSTGGGAGAAGASASSPSVASGAALGTEMTSLGTILVDPKGKSLYTFAADSPGHSTCTGTCLTYWPAVMASTTPAAVPGVTATLAVIMRADGGHQLTVNGWPVYTYAGDSGPGMTSGQGKNLSGGLWWVVSPAGTSIKSAAGASSAPASPSPSASKSSGGGGWA
jgi:predicted lipoprotein with Yx(FWY)xxD motif